MAPDQAYDGAALSMDDLVRLRDSITPDWCVYGEPEVGLPPGLFAGKIGHEGFGPIEPLHGCDLMLASIAPDLLNRAIADAETIAAKEAELIRLRGEVEAMRDVVEIALADPTTGESHE